MKMFWVLSIFFLWQLLLKLTTRGSQRQWKARVLLPGPGLLAQLASAGHQASPASASAPHVASPGPGWCRAVWPAPLHSQQLPLDLPGAVIYQSVSSETPPHVQHCQSPQEDFQQLPEGIFPESSTGVAPLQLYWHSVSFCQAPPARWEFQH